MRKTARAIIAEVRQKHRLTEEEILGHCRQRKFAWPRQEAMFQCYVQCPHLSYPQIARAFNNRDHSTVIFGVKAHCERLGIKYSDVQRPSPRHHVPDERLKLLVFAPASPSAYREAARL